MTAIAARRAGEALWRGLLEVLWPSRCPLCGSAVEGGVSALCIACAAQVAADLYEDRCPRCASPRHPMFAGHARCQRCQRVAYSYDRVYAAGHWQGPMGTLVVKLKFNRLKYLADHVGLYMAAVAARQGLRFDAVTPVPLFWTSRLRRRFNQSELLAAYLARHFDRPVVQALRRMRRTPSQRSFGRAGRFENVRNAFGAAAPTGSIKGKSILLVDDVLTTGATASECAKVLRKNGARRVTVLVAAKAVLGVGRVSTPSPRGAGY